MHRNDKGIHVIKTFVFVALILAAGCTRTNDVVQPTINNAGEYSSQVQPIFDRSCGTSSCHGGGPSGFAAGLDLTSYEGLLRGSKYGAVVIAGSPFMSSLVRCINPTDTTLSPISSVQMPASRNPLPRNEIESIAAWVRNGARNDARQIPFPEPRPLGKVFFSSQSVDLVGVVDRSTNLVMRYSSVGNALPFNAPPEAPHNVQVDDQGQFYYVSLIRGNKLKKYNAATNQFLGEVTVGTSPAHVVITADGSKAYITNFDQAVGRVFVVNTSLMTISRVISSPTMKATHGARLSHDGKYLYAGSNGTDLIHVINTQNDSLVTTVAVAPGVPPFGSFRYKPYQIAVRDDDKFIYATLTGTGQVSVIERSGDTFIWRDSIAVGTRPLQCEVTRDKKYLYVCNQGSGSVSVINALTNTLATTIVNVGQQPHGIDISEDSKVVYVTCENLQSAEPPHHPTVGSTDPGFLVLIDTGTQQVFKRIEVGGFAAGVSVSPGKGN